VDGGTLFLTTGTATWAARNVARQPEVALLLTGERLTDAPGRGIAPARYGDDRAGLPPWRVLLRIGAKYYAAPGALALELSNAAKWGLRARYYAQVKGGAGYLRVVLTGGEVLRRP
jgi:hypothetical protein